MTVEKYINQLDTSLDKLVDVICDLEKTTKPACAPYELCDRAGDIPTQPNVSPLANLLLRINDRVAACTQWVSDINERLELS